MSNADQIASAPHALRCRGALAAGLLATAAPVLAAPPAMEALANLSYQGIYEHPVTLTQGIYEGEPFVAGGAARPRVELLPQPAVHTDMDGDGREDAFVLLSESSGGSGSFLYLAAVTNGESGLATVGTAKIGDPVQVISLTADAGVASLEYVTTGPEEARCCPSQVIAARYGLQDGELKVLSQAERDRLSLATISEIPWQLTRLDWEEPLPDTLSVTAEIRDGQIAGFSGCNRYFGPISAPRPDRLAIGPLGATLMACPEPASLVEARYLEALGSAKQFGFYLGQLTIRYGEGERGGTLIYRRSTGD